MDTQYLSAVENTEFRQEYLDRLHEEMQEDQRQCIARIRYIQNWPRSEIQHIMATSVPFFAKLGFLKTRSTIEVAPDAFATFHLADDFKSLLFDHEALHASEIYHCPFDAGITIFEDSNWAEAERRACRNQLEMAILGKRRISLGHLKLLLQIMTKTKMNISKQEWLTECPDEALRYCATLKL